MNKFLSSQLCWHAPKALLKNLCRLKHIPAPCGSSSMVKTRQNLVHVSFQDVPAVRTLAAMTIDIRTRHIIRAEAFREQAKRSLHSYAKDVGSGVDPEVEEEAVAQLRQEHKAAMEAVSEEHKESLAAATKHARETEEKREEQEEANRTLEGRIGRLGEDLEHAQVLLSQTRKDQSSEAAKMADAVREAHVPLIQEKDRTIERLEEESVRLRKERGDLEANHERWRQGFEAISRDEIARIEESWKGKGEVLEDQLASVTKENAALAKKIQEGEIDVAHSQRKGRVAEIAIQEHLLELEEVLSLQDTSSIPEAGDFHMKTTDGRIILVEVKNYGGKVRGAQVEKFQRDLYRNRETIAGGLFISMMSGIVLPMDDQLGLNWHSGIPVFYLAHAKRCPEAIGQAVHVLVRAPALTSGLVPVTAQVQLQSLAKALSTQTKEANQAAKRRDKTEGQLRALIEKTFAASGDDASPPPESEAD